MASFADDDYYAILGVPATASPEELRAAFRRLARQYHPDVNPDPHAPERFRAVVAAYEVLSDPAQRAAYDAQRRTRSSPAAAHARRAAPPPSAAPFRSTMPPVRGLDRHATLRVPAERLAGGQVAFDHKRWERCPRCAGFGRLTEPVPCAACGGTGFHEGRLSDPCRVCWTTGTTTRCPACDARGGAWRTHHLEVRLPAGAHYGQQLRLRGMGYAGPRGGPPGDLYLELAPPLPPAIQALASNELIQAALRRLDEWLDRFAPYPPSPA